MKRNLHPLPVVLLFLSHLLTPFSFAQTPSFDWAGSMGGPTNDNCYSIALDASGNIYTTGYYTGTVDFDPGPGTFNLTAISTNDIFISKLNSSGGFVWAVSMGGSGVDQGSGITVDASGNVYSTGYFQTMVDFDPGPSTFNITSNGNYDCYVLKLDAAGNFVWAKSFGGTGSDNAKAIALDGSGNVLTTGYYAVTVDFDPGTGTASMTSAGSFDVYISKLDASGNFVWAKSMGGTVADYGISIDVDGSNNVHTTGYFNGTADFDPGTGTSTLASAGSSDVFVSKLDASGNFVWAKRLGGTGADIATAITIDGSGNVHSTGYFPATADFDPGTGTVNLTAAGGNDIYISKLDASGNYVWAKQMGGTSGDVCSAIYLDGSGNIYNAGYFGGSADFDPGVGTSNLTTFGGLDIFVSKLDASGNFSWVQQMGGLLNDYGFATVVDGFGNIFTAGHYNDVCDFDPGVGTYNLTSSGQTDVFVQKLQQCSNSTSTISPTACNSYVSPSGTYTWTSSGTYMDTIMNMSGCDSIITVNLTINNNSTSSISPSACYSYVSPSGTYTWTSSGTYTDTLTNMNGCDSIITVNLTINTNTTSSISPTACFSYVSPSANYTWTSSGTYNDTIANMAGCDSIITVNLTINTVDTSVTVNMVTLTATQAGATYQWVDCSNGQPVSGEVNQSYTPNSNGNYAVIVTLNGCTDTSNCHTVLGVGNNEQLFSGHISISPNPGSGFYSIYLGQMQKQVEVTVQNVLGEFIARHAYENTAKADLSIDAPAGIYFIRVSAGNVNSALIKVVKQN